MVLEKSLAKQAFSKLDDIDIYSVNYPQDYHRIFHLDLSRFTFSVRDTIKTLFVLVVCTLISKMFMHFQFMITTSIMVYILGIVIVSIWTSGYIYSLLASLFSVQTTKTNNVLIVSLTEKVKRLKSRWKIR